MLDRPGGDLEFEAVSKMYGPTTALASFTHRFESGRVHALMGKNGSGKSTLVKVLAGVTPPSDGVIRVNGATRSFNSPHDAFEAGIVTVHQELSLIPTLSVGENVFLGRLPKKSIFGLSVVDWERLHKDAGELLGAMGLDIDSRQLVSSLSVGHQQVVEIVKAMSYRPSILLLDEPTSALATREVELLFKLVRRLRERGVTMLYITHRMSELFTIADTCTVLRDGELIGSVEMADTKHAQIVEMMFGSTASEKRPARHEIDRHGTPALQVRDLHSQGRFQDISFDIYKGEIVGIAGLLGAGRTELMRSIFGADPFDGGEVKIAGSAAKRHDPTFMKEMGLGYTPENRKEVGLVQILPTFDNLCMASLAAIAPAGLITRELEKPSVSKQISDLHIKAGDPMQAVSSLSGGNQQKVVIGNWLNTSPKVMFFDEPSRGVDVQAKRQIFEIIWQQAKSGLAVLFVSTELEEVLEVSDRILVMREGSIVAEVDPTAITLTELYRLCMEGEMQ